MDVTERIIELLRERNWSVYRLGKESGLSQSTLAHIFRKDSEPTISTLEIICKAFGITLSQFFADGNLVSLTAEQWNILNKTAKLSGKQKKLLLELMDNMK